MISVLYHIIKIIQYQANVTVWDELSVAVIVRTVSVPTVDVEDVTPPVTVAV